MLARTPHITRRVYVPRRPGPSLTGYTATTKMTGILPVVEDLGFGVFVAARVAPLLARMNGRSRSQLPPASDVSVPQPTDITDHTARALITSTNKRRRHDPGSSPISNRYLLSVRFFVQRWKPEK